jgi:hypothetical protein
MNIPPRIPFMATLLAVALLGTASNAPAQQPPQAPPQIDIAGEWQSRVHEDQAHRGPGGELGDYTGIALNDAGRQYASTWNAGILALPEVMSKPHPAQYFMRGPGPQMRIKKITDPYTLRLVAYTLEGVFGRDDRVIWMDGRPHPSDIAEHTWDGFSTGVAKGNQLTITTTHMKFGFVQRNGVPASDHATMTEVFVRHGNLLTLFSSVDDPVYLEEPMVRTSQWVMTSSYRPDERFSFEVVEEDADQVRGYVPSWPLGTRQDEFARRYGLPYEATQGHRAALYPEYEQQLAREMQAMATPAKAKGAGKEQGK